MDDLPIIADRNDFELWAITRASSIVAEQGGSLGRAARGGDEETIRAAGDALGSAIREALLEVFDALLEGAD